MRDVPIESIEFTHLQTLQQNSVREGRQLEYKLELPGNKDEDKREFLYDVSALANAGGGYIIWGIAEARDSGGKNTGQIEKLVGLPDLNFDRDVARLEGTLQTALDPRIPGLRFKQVDGGDQGPLLVLRIPRSWAAPHAVTYGGLFRFYSRNSAGKYQLDVRELRAAFFDTEAAHTKPQRFRLDRIAKIVAGETPLPLRSGARLCVHIVPIGERTLALTARETEKLKPMMTNTWSRRFNFDGCVAYADSGTEPKSADTYVQIFRDGSVEAVEVGFLGFPNGNIRSGAFEWELVREMNAYISFLRHLGIDSSLVAFVSLLGVSGFRMGVSRENYRWRNDEDRVFDRDDLLLPELMIEGTEVTGSDMQPIFDIVWQAAGWEKSLYYDERGNWSPPH